MTAAFRNLSLVGATLQRPALSEYDAMNQELIGQALRMRGERGGR
jgi:hypothetical protein